MDEEFDKPIVLNCLGNIFESDLIGVTTVPTMLS
ncbi:hypothetical protein SAMN05216302_101228 [Nitrosomonas aestuarii]|uniref:Uncharacterized protein n=1 Tax=Nitrosomonas aestuarii TaxID=52441 RepID=A0A1I4BJ51_9PROT|nr:hypothetical protein SAMN05216302_101228 [Nitrosomonas aestuarii]